MQNKWGQFIVNITQTKYKQMLRHIISGDSLNEKIESRSKKSSWLFTQTTKLEILYRWISNKSFLKHTVFISVYTVLPSSVQRFCQSLITDILPPD